MIGLIGFGFTNTPMEDVIVHHTTRFPVFGTEGDQAELDALGKPPAAQDPTKPYPGFYPDSPKEWIAHHRAILRDAPTQPWRVLFLGDSITQGWLRTEEWRTIFKPLGAFNMGIGGDRTSQILWRIEHGELDRVHPNLVVLMIGTNNMWADCEQFGAAGVASGTRAVVKAIQAKLPKSRIVLLDVLPMLEDPKHPVRERIRSVNAETKSLADGRTVLRLEVTPTVIGPGDTIDRSVMSDFIHPTSLGYTRIASALRPVVERALSDDK